MRVNIYFISVKYSLKILYNFLIFLFFLRVVFKRDEWFCDGECFVGDREYVCKG